MKAGLLAGAALIPTTAALAEDATPPSGNDIVITAPLSRSREDVIAGVSVMSGTDLVRNMRSTVAETLARTPGVSASSFGPSASRPILRGFQGDRVRVLTDGIGSIDASGASADHAVVINPLLAERIEVVRGPSALLYGSEAIGGVVNVIDTRIPRSIPENGFRITGQGTYGSAANERSGGLAVDVKAAENLVIHADGSYLKTGNMDIGGYALTPALRRTALATAAAGGDPTGEIDFAGNAAVKNTLPNTRAKTWDAALGATLITETGSLGFSYSHYDSLYGVPIRYATQLGEGQEAPRLDVKQDRLDARAEIDANGSVIEKIRFRIGGGRYRHYELEQDNSIGTAFYTQGMEGRLELVQAQHGGWRGVVGGQFLYRDFNVVGDEAFLPRNQTDQQGVFTLQQLEMGKLKLEAGARFEHAVAASKPRDDQPQFTRGKRGFDLVSGSIGASYAITPGLRFGVNLSHSERAPSAEELFANGPHGGTEAFEIGDPGLKKESANGAEAVLHVHGRGFDLEASAFYQRFNNYIDDFPTGEIEDGLPVYQSAQADARYYGFEVQGSVDLAHIGDTTFALDGLADYVNAQVISQSPVPRIPPLRVLAGIEAKNGRIFGRAEVERVMKQDRIAAFETETPGYTMVNASIGVHPFADHQGTSIILSANNLTDVVARRATSFLKDYAPLAGRDIRITARFQL
ncbi:TonB-dependent receptor [Sphingomonas sp. AP4-R1]|uniref:TonB-dependent receptor n=1 Tax=Sphingomonas sp. AP4-R1 TaxID=2735134 RepID=UPI001493B992|nr:TonB-dependent receptor [Sphingomonas sp. AP4-R1]QJU60388.1 TonB-dependent receptor [Sphingomonas sp. AP4-R1]